ncbi:MAG: hypothetical protein ACK5XB_05075 [Rhodospirillales bacterium]
MATLADAIVIFPRLEPIAAQSATHMLPTLPPASPACIDLHQGAAGKLLQTP